MVPVCLPVLGKVSAKTTGPSEPIMGDIRREQFVLLVIGGARVRSGLTKVFRTKADFLATKSLAKV